MEITRTINSDKRYYLDEGLVINADSLINTISQFNNIKIQMYNVLYDKTYHDDGPLTEKTYSAWAKDKFRTNDYYNCSIYTAASSMISSQKELKKLYIKTKESDLSSRDSKIKSTKDQLDKKRLIKDSIVAYMPGKNRLGGEWINPYKGYQGKVAGKNIILPGNKKISLNEYERKIEADIRRLSSRLRLITAARNRAQKKLDDLKTHNPRRIVFGSKNFYSEKDMPETDIQKWKQAFFDKRHASMSLPGRHTSKSCNFLVRKASAADIASDQSLAGHPDSLIVKCMDGKQAIFLDFQLARNNEIWLDMLGAEASERKPICYNFQIRTDKNGRKYMIVSVTLVLENVHCNESLDTGCVSIDLNYDHVAITDIDEKGNRISGEVLRFNPDNKTSGQISDEIGRIMSKVGKFCSDRKKPLIMEDIDTTISKHGMRYGNAKGNKHASIFAYRKMASCLENQSYERSFGIMKINPAYTSQIGKILYMRKLGISIHEAASYVIGLKGMGLRELMLPDIEMADRLTPALKDKVLNKGDISSLMDVWKYISSKMKGVFTHSFYRKIPYQYKKGEELTKAGKLRKPKTLIAIANEMKSWTARYY